MIWLALYIVLFFTDVRGMEYDSLYSPLLNIKEYHDAKFDADLCELYGVSGRTSRDMALTNPTGDSLAQGSLSLYDLVLELKSEHVPDCLLSGTSLQTRDAHGMTVFHHLAKKDVSAQETLNALFVSPRSYVSKTVLKMGIRGNHIYSRMMKWHIAGLVKVLLMADHQGKIPFDYTVELAKDSEWQVQFSPDIQRLIQTLGDDITLEYINIHAGEK